MLVLASATRRLPDARGGGLTALVNGCVREFAARADAEHQRLDVARQSCSGDDALLRRMFGNLLSNA